MAEHTKKKNKLLTMFVPMKGDKPAEIIRKCVLIAALIVAIVCVVLIVSQLSTEAKDNQNNEDIRDIKELNTGGSFVIDEEEVEEIRNEVPGILDKYVDLYAENNDLVGWIKIDDLPIDYPVVQTTDNEYYLHRNFYGEEMFSGTIFMDYHDPLTAESTPDNIILYGHNMANGSMFGNLILYSQQKFRDEHPYVYLNVSGTVYRYEIFAAYTADIVSDTYRIGFGSSGRKQQAISLTTAISHTVWVGFTI